MRATLVGFSSVLVVLAFSAPSHADAPKADDTEVVEKPPFSEIQSKIVAVKERIIMMRHDLGPSHPYTKRFEALLREYWIAHPREAAAAEREVVEAARLKETPVKHPRPPQDMTQEKIAAFKERINMLRRDLGPNHPVTKRTEAALDDLEQSVRKRK
jgi:hypothetical protein